MAHGGRGGNGQAGLPDRRRGSRRFPARPGQQRCRQAGPRAGLCRAADAAGQVPGRFLPGAAGRRRPAGRQGRDLPRQRCSGCRCTSCAPRWTIAPWEVTSLAASAMRPGAALPIRATRRSAGAPTAPETGSAPAIDWDALRVAACVPETGIELIPNETFLLEAGLRAPARRRFPQGLLRRPGGHRADETQDRTAQGAGNGRGRRSGAGRHGDHGERQTGGHALYPVGRAAASRICDSTGRAKPCRPVRQRSPGPPLDGALVLLLFKNTPIRRLPGARPRP